MGGGGLAHTACSLFLPAYLNRLSVLPLPHTLCQGPRLPAPGWLSQAGSPPVAVSPARAHTLGPAHIHLFSYLSPSSWALFLSLHCRWLGRRALPPLLVPLNVACTPSTLASPLTKTSPYLTNQNLSKLIFGTHPTPPNYCFNCQIEQANPRSSSPLPPGTSPHLLRLQPAVGFPGCDAITLGSDCDCESVSSGWCPDSNLQRRKHHPHQSASGLQAPASPLQFYKQSREWQSYIKHRNPFTSLVINCQLFGTHVISGTGTQGY